MERLLDRIFINLREERSNSTRYKKPVTFNKESMTQLKLKRRLQEKLRKQRENTGRDTCRSLS